MNDLDYNFLTMLVLTLIFQTDKVYNNIYPDRPKTSKMVIPKSLRQTEDRPRTQKRYRKKCLTKVEDYKDGEVME